MSEQAENEMQLDSCNHLFTLLQRRAVAGGLQEQDN